MITISPRKLLRKSSKKGVLLTAVVAGSILVLLAFTIFNSSLIVQAANKPGRSTTSLGDKDDLPNAATDPVSCTRAGTGTGVIQGKITDSKSGKPIANAYIGISPGTVSSFACYTHTNADGVYSFTKLNSGAYNLSASRWTVSGTAPLYKDSIVRQIPIGNSTATINVKLSPLRSPGYRIIGNTNAKNIIMVDMDETYFDSWFRDQKSVANPTVTPATHSVAKLGVNAYEEWTQYGYSPIDHYQLATGAYPSWRTPDGPAAYWTQPDPALDTNLWYSGSASTAEEFGQESIFDVAKSYGMNTAVIGGNDYPAGHITNANIDEVNLTDPNPCSVPTAEVNSMTSFIGAHLNNPNGFLLYAPLTQAEGFNTENVSPDAPPGVTSCKQENGWTYTQASIWDDQALSQLLQYLNTTKQGNSTLFQNTSIIITADEAQNDKTNFDNFYPTLPGEPNLGTTRHTPFVIEGPNIHQGATYTKQMRIDDASVNAMASLGLPSPFDTRGNYIPDFFVTPPKVLLPPTQTNPTPSQGYVALLENNVDGYTTTIQAQNTGTAQTTRASLIVYSASGKVVVNKQYTVPVAANGALLINAADLGLPSGFSGTALIQADQPLSIVTNETAAGAPVQSIEGYIAAETGSNLYAPVILNGVNKLNSYLSITNLAPCAKCATKVTVDFYNAAGKRIARQEETLASFGRFKINAEDVGFKSGTTASATVTSNPAEPLAATVYTVGSGKQRSFTYNAFSAGDTAHTAALIENGVNGQTTELDAQNTVNTPANVTITYRGTNGATVATQKVTLPARASGALSAAKAGLPVGFTGSAFITSDQPIVAITRIITAGGVSAYNVTRGQDFTLYTDVYAPQVVNGVNGVTSAITVTNTGTKPTTEKVQYFDNSGKVTGNTPTASLAPGASYTFNQGDAASGLPVGFTGTAIISSSAIQHSAVVVTFTGHGSIRSYNGAQAQSGQLILTIGQLRQNYASFNGLVVTVVGATVTRSLGSNWFIQDSTGGIRVYVGGGTGQQIGDVETVTGVLTDYNGEIEIDPSDTTGVVKTGTGPVPAPLVITTQQLGQLKYNSPIDGLLVTIPVSTITKYSPPIIGLTDSTGVQGIVYFDSSAQKNINLANFKLGEQVTATGVLTVYGNDLSSSAGELNPELTSDFVAH